MRVALLVLLACSGAAMAQELPPAGTYYKPGAEPFKWPDPATVPVGDRPQWEALLGSARRQQEEAAETARYRAMTPEQKQEADDAFRRALDAVHPPQ